MIRGITGTGEGNGPYISIHDGFMGLTEWAGFLTGADRITLDIHPYFAFDGNTAVSPIDTGTGADAGGIWPAAACNSWASSMNTRFDHSSFDVIILIISSVVLHSELQWLENLVTVSTTVAFIF